LGIDAGRIQTVSYGKERPQAAGSNESAWAQNRRAVTITVQ
jgi:peptidoglycan-associated lipoprotein